MYNTDVKNHRLSTTDQAISALLDPVMRLPDAQARPTLIVEGGSPVLEVFA